MADQDQPDWNKSKKPNPKTKRLILAAVVIVVIVALLLYAASLSAGYASVSASYKALLGNYSSLSLLYNTASAGYQANYTLLYLKYNQSQYDLTHMYAKTLFNGSSIRVPARKINYTTGVYTGGYWNYSFYAPYGGYVMLNATAVPKTQNVNDWVIDFSKQKPYLQGGKLSLDSGVSAITTVAPSVGTTYMVPVLSGTNYVVIYNVNVTTQMNVTLNMKYLGYYSS